MTVISKVYLLLPDPKDGVRKPFLEDMKDELRISPLLFTKVP